MYLSVFLAKNGLGSRRKAIDYIKINGVFVNGIEVKDPALHVHSNDIIRLNTHTIIVQAIETFVYCMLNKPTGYSCTHADKHANKTIFDLIPPHYNVPGITFVGRLDKESSGLLLLTNDGEWAHRLQHPRFNISKVYIVRVDKKLQIESIEALRQGIVLDDGFCKPDKITQLNTNELQIVLHSGKKRIIRRLLQHLGYTVTSLHRIQYGPYALGTINPGECIAIDPSMITPIHRK